MKRVFCYLIIVLLLGAAGCYSPIDNDEISTVTKQVVDLSIDNYLDYLTVETVSQSEHLPGSVVSITTRTSYFSGALSYAFYDNVVITYNCFESYPEKITVKQLKLDVGGNGIITESCTNFGGTTKYEVIEVTGTVTFLL